MKYLLLTTILIIFTNYSNADIIYTEPVSNSRYVSINNNIIIGFDEMIESSDLNLLIKVTGSSSGIHKGKIFLTKDKKKIIFKPYMPFAFNEQVEVRLNRLKTSSQSVNNLSYTFRTQLSKPFWDHRNSLMNETGNSSYNGSVNHTDSTNLPELIVSISNNPSPGNLYLSNFPFLIIPNTPYLLIADNSGVISYYREVNVWALDYKKQPSGLLTYYEGEKFYGENIQHNKIDSFECGNGYYTDHHELQITNDGHAFLMSYDPQLIDMSLIVPGGDPNAIVIGLIIQEIDENKNVLFQWRSWDHFKITDAVYEDLTDSIIDYAHGNAIDVDNDGNLMISSRNMSEITKINRVTGDIIWRLGGAKNQFTFPNDSIKFSYQHDIRRVLNGNVTLFDNGNKHSPPFSRAVEYQLDEVNKIATLVWQYKKNPNVFAFAMGSVQRLKNGNTLIGWGSKNPNITEVTPVGNISLEMSLPKGIYTYRIFRDEVKLTLNLKLAVQGFYNTLTRTLNIKDTVTAYLRQINSPYNIVDSARSVVDSVNLKGNFSFYNVNPGTYYMKIKHRNALETWSKAGGETFIPGDVYLYDFTSSGSQAYGSNLILKGSKYCTYSGDVNQDGAVDGSDGALVDNAAFNFVSGYVPADVTGDDLVDGSDAAIVDNNAYNLVTKITPFGTKPFINLIKP